MIAEADRRHDFGAVIARPGRVMTHAYRLTNATGHDLKLAEPINRKPCCGVIKLDKSSLRPGESATVEVKLAINKTFGDVVHETEIVADPPLPAEVVLRTTAHAYPAIRVEEVPDASAAEIIRGGQPRRSVYRIIATGTADDPPADLGKLDLASTIPARWEGPKEESLSDDGLAIVTRRLGASLAATGEPGEQVATIALRDGKRTIYEHRVTWEVFAPLTVTPKVAVVKPGSHQVNLVLVSRDRAPFRVLRIDTKRAGIQARSQSEASGRSQTIVVDVDGAKSDGKEGLTVFTDHPAQATVKIPVLVLD